MKLPALFIALALGCGASAFAADHAYDSGSAGSSANASAHRIASDFKGAMHKLGAATKHAILRADAALQHVVHHGSGNSNA